jgi:methylmalonyl-CoA/ethylmalonyl-CoA epimerase
MKVLKIDHIGVAVENLESTLAVYRDILGLGDTEVELLASTDPEGPIGKFIAAKGQGVQHVAFRVENLEEALAELKAKGVRLIDEKPRYGAGGARIAFLHPKATNGVLVELCERKA